MNVYKHEAIDGVCIDKHDRHSNILWILDRSVYSIYYIKFKSAPESNRHWTLEHVYFNSIVECLKKVLLLLLLLFSHL